MPKAALNDVQLDPRLEEPGGVAMTQRVDPAELVEIDEKWETTEKPYITWKAEDD